MAKDYDNLEKKVRGWDGFLGKAAIYLSSVLMLAGCNGGGGGGSDKPKTPPTLNWQSELKNQYEHLGNVQTVYAKDTDGGINKVWLEIEKDGVKTRVDMYRSGTNEYSTNLLDIESGRAIFRAGAEDNDGLVSYTGERSADFWADEASGDNELESKLQLLKGGGDIIDYIINTEFDCGGTMVKVDAAVLLPDFRWYAMWYQGENDGEHAAEKATLENYSIGHGTINACLQKDIADKVDAISEGGWLNNCVVKAISKYLFYSVAHRDGHENGLIKVLKHGRRDYSKGMMG